MLRPPKKKGTLSGVPFLFRRLARSLSEQLDASDVGSITDAMAQLHDARVSAGTRCKSLADLGEQLGRDFLVLEPALHQTAGMQIAAAGERDEPLRERTQLLRLRLGGLNPAVPEEAGRHVVQRRLLVARRARELAAFGAVAHYSSSAPVNWA